MLHPIWHILKKNKSPSISLYILQHYWNFTSQILPVEYQNLNVSIFSMMQPSFLLNVAIHIKDKLLSAFYGHLQIYFVKAAKKYRNFRLVCCSVAILRVYSKSMTFQFPILCQQAGAQAVGREHGQES